MAHPEETRARAIAMLQTGSPIKEVADKLGVSRGIVSKWNRKLRAENEEQLVQDMVKADPATLLLVADKVKDEVAEAPLPEKDIKVVQKKVDALVDGAIGLQKIDEKFQTVVYELLAWAEERTKGEMTIKDWSTIASTIGSLYTAIFSKNVTNVNVMNTTNISSEKREIFKASKGI